MAGEVKPSEGAENAISDFVGGPTVVAHRLSKLFLALVLVATLPAAPGLGPQSELGNRWTSASRRWRRA
jgi:hypothetical protein